MKNLLEQIKQDSRFEPLFFGKEENIDNLSSIIYKVETSTRTTSLEKKIYGVEFKKGQDLVNVEIDVIRNHQNNSDIIFVIMPFYNHLAGSGSITENPIYFTSFEECKNFVIEEIIKLSKKYPN